MCWRIAILSVVLLGCGGSQKDVTVQGPDTEIARLAGEWKGEYKGNETGRSGPVTFSLQVGQHTAEGEVLMSGTTPLKIEFVQVKGGQIRGTIGLHTDPGCSCQVETSFLGTLAGDTLSGMFETKIGTTGQIQTGSWTVTRQAR
jgi:hypothetical protein